jgi:hypothetical protein
MGEKRNPLKSVPPVDKLQWIQLAVGIAEENKKV